MNKTFTPERAWWKVRRMEKKRDREKVLTSQSKKSIERHKIWLFHEGCVYVWEFGPSCGTHDWRDSYPRPHVSQWPPLPFCPSLPRSVLHQAEAAVKRSLSESSRPMKRCWCVKHLFYPLLWDYSPAEYRRHREASINLWPLVETYFPHTPPPSFSR